MHKTYKHMVKNADAAVLLIHGIVGTPNHFSPFLPLIPADMSIYNILLDGHGKGVEDFSKTSMKKWEKQVALAANELALTHNKIYIAAHSMGCLLAMEQCVKNTKVRGLFLLAPPIKLFLRPQMVTSSLKVYFDKIDPSDEAGLAAKQCSGVTHSKNPVKYLGWIPRFLELFGKIKDTRKLIDLIDVPCNVYLSCNDEMVSLRSKNLLESNPNISVFPLKKSGHYYYEKEDLQFLKRAFTDFLTCNRPQERP